MTKAEIRNLVKKYSLMLTEDNRVRVLNIEQAKRDGIMDTLKTNKDEIQAYLVTRRTNQGSIEGLAEIRSAIEELKSYNRRFARSFEEEAGGGVGIGRKPKTDIQALKDRYPVAAAYLRAEECKFKANRTLSQIGRDALDELIDEPADYINIMAKMDKAIEAETDKHIWD